MRFILFILFSITLHQVSGQQTKLSYHLLTLSMDEALQNKNIAVLIKGDTPAVREEIIRLGGRVKFSSGPFCAATIAVSHLRELAASSFIERMEEGHVQLEPLNDKMLINNRIDQVHLGLSPLIQGYDGKDVVVGIIDSGLDFTHPDFKDSLGQSRVLWIWDHVLTNAGNTPQPYNYGQQFSKNMIDAGNAAAHIDQIAHGTHVTGIATANGDSLAAFKGAAPKADIIAVKINQTLNDDAFLSSVADAVNYIFSKADSLNKPCVINISYGTYFGSHDGKDLQAQAIDNLISSQNGRMVVAAAGNLGNYPLHLQQTPNSDSTFTWFANASSLYIEFWADTADLNNVQFTIGADKTAAGFENRAQLPWTSISSKLGILAYDTIRSFSGNRIATLQTYGQLIGNRYSMIYYILPDSGSYNFRLMSRGTGKLDVWSFDMISTGLPNPTIYPSVIHYKLPDFSQNICSSFQCSDKVICTGQYVNRNNYIDVNGNVQSFPTTEGALGASSSRGPTRDGRIKPDITSTGEVTLSALKLSSAAWFLANQPYKLAQGGLHIRDGGTSSASPAVAGAIALYLQKNPTASWQDIRNHVILCAKQDIYTGNNLPDNNWGAGKLDAMNMMTGCTALPVQEVSESSLIIYPNPAKDIITIGSTENRPIQHVRVFNMLGQQIYTLRPRQAVGQLEVNLSQVPPGIYMIVTDLSQGTRASQTLIVH